MMIKRNSDDDDDAIVEEEDVTNLKFILVCHSLHAGFCKTALKCPHITFNTVYYLTERVLFDFCTVQFLHLSSHCQHLRKYIYFV